MKIDWATKQLVQSRSIQYWVLGMEFRQYLPPDLAPAPAPCCILQNQLSEYQNIKIDLLNKTVEYKNI
ncbi:hypothetical protein [Planktothrix agardhii]|uniref:hypothetical protein n=1 Tax=Planktothrix agardhii TaxID=1160 RepID=UPI003782F6B8